MEAASSKPCDLAADPISVYGYDIVSVVSACSYGSGPLNSKPQTLDPKPAGHKEAASSKSGFFDQEGIFHL